MRNLGLRYFERFICKGNIDKISAKLWGGFSEQALKDLQSIVDHPWVTPKKSASACRELARWYASHGNPAKALSYLHIHKGRKLGSAKHQLLVLFVEIHSLLELGRRAEVRQLIDQSMANGYGGNANLRMARANTFGPDDDAATDWQAARLSEINTVLESNHLATLKIRDPSKPLHLANLATSEVFSAKAFEDQVKISVLIPAYDAAETLPIAIESLLAQTWRNIEVIIVDDCSSDETYAVAKKYSQLDSRLLVFRMEQNRGAYVARNYALHHATGDYVTVHDADDWSHPQKLELQVQSLLVNPTSMGSISSWIRCEPDVVFRGTARVSAHWINSNASSLMMRRQDILDCGRWDEVRVGADSELLRRIKRKHNKKGAIQHVLEGVPLSFGIDQKSSLTRQSVTHVFTLFYGVRRIYHEASSHYIDTRLKNLNWRLPSSAESRAFPAPRSIQSIHGNDDRYDVMFIMDFCILGGSFISMLNYLNAAISSGLKVAVFHWRRYDLNPNSKLNYLIRELIQEGKVTQIAPGESVDVETVIVGYPVILQYAIDMPPRITCKKFMILVNQMPARLISGQDIQYDPRVVAQNLHQLFGLKPIWTPISNYVRRLMEEDGRFEYIHHENWTPLIDVAEYDIEPRKWRGDTSDLPVVGRHSRDHYTKWPKTRRAVMEAYCVEKACKVVILGGASHAICKLKKVPSNWEVHAFNSMDVAEFLGGLDFFIHYPLEDYIEEYGRAILEAMLMGVPVILPPVFEPTFGNAALYAEPGEVWQTVESLWNNAEKWQERSEKGRQFAIDSAGWHHFVERLERLRDVPALAGN